MANFESQGLPYQIRVMEGELSVANLQADQPPGIIQLVGRSLPLQPIVYEGSQRVVTKFYPGNPAASQQLIGSTEKPSVVNGDWSDRYLGPGQARGLMALFDDLRVRGASLEVSWGGTLSSDASSQVVGGSPIVRVGVISNAKFTITRDQDILWELTFDWRSRGEVSVPVVSSTSKLNPRQDLSQVTDDLELSSALWDAYSQGPGPREVGLPQRVLDGMARAQDAVLAANESIASAAAAIAVATVIPANSALQLIGACSGGIDAMRDFELNILAINPLAAEVRDSALGLLRFKNDTLDQLLQASAAKERCYDARAGVQEIALPDILADVLAPAGTSCRDLAFKYYGDPDLGWAIQDFNNFPTSAVPPAPTGPSDQPNRPVRIPRLQPGTSDLRQRC